RRPLLRATNQQRPFTSSLPPSSSQQQQPFTVDMSKWESLSPEAKLSFLEQGLHKWGWVVYRTSYAKEFDGAWDDLQRLVARWREALPASPDAGPDVAKRMDFVFVEDDTLEGAELEELRGRFGVWAQGELEGGEVLGGTRYGYFLRFDGEGAWGGHVGVCRAVVSCSGGGVEGQDGGCWDGVVCCVG
ncbi:hypothetical protein QBC34DRAFT_455931, partial [Podospora aff. communis PSN243]